MENKFTSTNRVIVSTIKKTPRRGLVHSKLFRVSGEVPHNAILVSEARELAIYLDDDTKLR
jgi:hypothetical protein